MNTWWLRGDTPTLVDSALAELPIGIAVLDRTHTLKFVNATYRDIMELPEAVAPIGMSFNTILEQLARRGEFLGYVGADLARQRFQQAADGIASRIERSRPNGHWIEAQLHPLKDGGILQVCSDITSQIERRWRSEGQIVDLKARVRDLEEQLGRRQAE